MTPTLWITAGIVGWLALSICTAGFMAANASRTRTRDHAARKTGSGALDER